MSKETDKTAGGEEGWLLFAFKSVAAVLIYFGAAGVGLEMSIWDERAPLVWLPAGFALALIMMGGWRYVPALAVAAVLTDYFQESRIPEALITGLGSIVVITGAGFVLRKLLDRRTGLERISDVGIFAGIGILAAGVWSLLTTFILIRVHTELQIDFQLIWFYRWLGVAMGILILAPPLLVWYAQTRINWNNRNALEVGIWLLMLAAVSWVIFRNWAPIDTLRYPLELALFPALAWGAIRFGPRGATTGILIVAMMGANELRDVIGFDAERFHTQPPEALWLFVGIVALTGLFLAAIITEFRNREDQVRTNEERLRAFIEAMPDVAFVITAGGVCTEVFAARGSELEERHQQARGKTIDEGWPLSDIPEARTAITKAVETDEVTIIEYQLRNGDREYWFEGRIAPMEPIEPITEKMVVWVSYDISVRRKAEEELRRRDALIEGVANAKTSLLTLRDTRDAVERSLAALGEAANVSRAILYENRMDEETKRAQMVVRYIWPREDQPIEDAERVFDYDREFPGWREQMSRNESIRAKVEDLNPRTVERPFMKGVESILVTPVWTEGEFWGVLAFQQRNRRRDWNDSEVSALVSSAASVGAYIESRRSEEALRQAKEAADRASMAKGEFLAMMSHEIRTPMNSILGFADLLSQTDMEPSQKEFLEIINRSGKALLELINNILDYSKIESRGIELEVAPFQLETVLIEALELVSVKAREKGLRLDYNLDDPSSGSYLGDSHRLRQIILNLVNNAVKFTSKGSVTVKVKSTPQSQGRWKLYFQVVDQGIGIPKTKIDRLFKPFSQVDSSTTRQFGGTGLGLVICKRLVERMGGQIWVESDEGRGSIFHFTIVVKGGEVPKARRERSAEEPIAPGFGREHPLTILLAEDDVVNQQLAIEILRKIGYSLDIAETGVQVLEKLKLREYDVILMDVQMPDMDGLEATQRIRAGEAGDEYRNIYIIATTAYALPEDRDRCFEAGVNGYLPKPILIPQLRDALGEAYKRIHSARS